MNKKTLLSVAAAGALASALALAGCGVPAATEATSSAPAEASAASSAATGTAATESSPAAEGAAETTTSTAAEATEQPAASSEPIANMVNPWQDAATADEAAQGAGVGSFSVPQPGELTIGPFGPWTFQYMDGLAEADAPAGATQLIIRKGSDPNGNDISGDYTVYPLQWTQNIKGLEVACYGHEENMAHKVLWSLDGVGYCILVHGQGDSTDTFGLGADDVASLINGIQ